MLNQYINTRSLLLQKLKASNNTMLRACYNHIHFCIGKMTPEQWDGLIRNRMLIPNSENEGFIALKRFLSGNKVGKNIMNDLLADLKKEKERKRKRKLSD